MSLCLPERTCRARCLPDAVRTTGQGLGQCRVSGVGRLNAGVDPSRKDFGPGEEHQMTPPEGAKAHPEMAT